MHVVVSQVITCTPGSCCFSFLEAMLCWNNSVGRLCTPASSSTGIALPPTSLPLQQKMLFMGSVNLFPWWRKASVITGPHLTIPQHSQSTEAVTPEKGSSFLWAAKGDDTCTGYPEAAASLEEEEMASLHQWKSHTLNNTRNSPMLCAECLDVHIWPTDLPEVLKRL